MLRDYLIDANHVQTVCTTLTDINNLLLVISSEINYLRNRNIVLVLLYHVAGVLKFKAGFKFLRLLEISQCGIVSL